MSNGSASTVGLRGACKSTLEGRQEIVRAAAKTFGTKGYPKGSLIDMAVLEYRDAEDLETLAEQKMPQGLDLFGHSCRTAVANTQREGIVQTYAAITGESVTENHPARGLVTKRFSLLRGYIEDALCVVCGPDLRDDICTHAATSVIGVMDGIQLQWLLDKNAVALPAATKFAIEAILVAATAGNNRPRPLSEA